MTTVSKENLRKVENYFVETIKAVGNKRIERTVLEIAEGAGVALATAHKAIKDLENRGTLSVIKPSSRRFPITYIYRGDVAGFELSIDKDKQIEYLQNINAKQVETIADLEKRVRELENIINKKILQNV